MVTGMDYAAVTADANGRLLYGPVDWPNAKASLNTIVEFNGVFVEHQFMTRGAPGAILGEVTLNPYVIFISDPGYGEDYTLFGLDFDSSITDPVKYTTLSSLIDTALSITSSIPTSSTLYSGKLVCDYMNGQIYIFASYGGGNGLSIFKMDGFEDSYSQVLDVSSVFTHGQAFSVQQMILIDGGLRLLVIASSGAFTINTGTFTIDKVWESKNYPTDMYVLNGGFQADDNSPLCIGREV